MIDISLGIDHRYYVSSLFTFFSMMLLSLKFTNLSMIVLGRLLYLCNSFSFYVLVRSLYLYQFPTSLWEPFSLLLRIFPMFPLPHLLCHLFVNCFAKIYLLARLIYVSLDLSDSLRFLGLHLLDHLIQFPVFLLFLWHSLYILSCL